MRGTGPQGGGRSSVPSLTSSINWIWHHPRSHYRNVGEAGAGVSRSGWLIPGSHRTSPRSAEVTTIVPSGNAENLRNITESGLRRIRRWSGRSGPIVETLSRSWRPSGRSHDAASRCRCWIGPAGRGGSAVTEIHVEGRAVTESELTAIAERGRKARENLINALRECGDLADGVATFEGQELIEVLDYLDSLRFVMAESGQILAGVVRGDQG